MGLLNKTINTDMGIVKDWVTPCMGVWIETGNMLEHLNPIKSHPVWVCGLKLWHCPKKQRLVLSHPVWVCGLKLSLRIINLSLIKSHPVWVCGLKQARDKTVNRAVMSHPVWVCGLKLLRHHQRLHS